MAYRCQCFSDWQWYMKLPVPYPFMTLQWFKILHSFKSMTPRECLVVWLLVFFHKFIVSLVFKLYEKRLINLNHLVVPENLKLESSSIDLAITLSMLQALVWVFPKRTQLFFIEQLIFNNWRQGKYWIFPKTKLMGLFKKSSLSLRQIVALVLLLKCFCILL